MSKPKNIFETICEFIWPGESDPAPAPTPSADSGDPPAPEPEKRRARKFCAILYPEDETHASAIQKIMEGGYKYAAILHNEDVYESGEHKGEKKKPHWHLILDFPNAVWDTSLSKELGIARNYLQICHNLEGALLYLVHYGYEATKFQYDVSEVFGPLKQKLVTLLQDDDEGTRVLHIVDIINDHPGPIGYSELLKKAVAGGLYADLRRMGHFATGLIREHNDPYYRNEWELTRNALDRDGFRQYEKCIRGEY